MEPFMLHQLFLGYLIYGLKAELQADIKETNEYYSALINISLRTESHFLHDKTLHFYHRGCVGFGWWYLVLLA